MLVAFAAMLCMMGVAPSAHALAPALGLDLASVDFGKPASFANPATTAFDPQTVTITNTGTGDTTAVPIATLTGADATHFSTDSTTCSSVLHPADTCTVTLLVDTNDGPARSATLHVAAGAVSIDVPVTTRERVAPPVCRAKETFYFAPVDTFPMPVECSYYPDPADIVPVAEPPSLHSDPSVAVPVQASIRVDTDPAPKFTISIIEPHGWIGYSGFMRMKMRTNTGDTEVAVRFVVLSHAPTANRAPRVTGRHNLGSVLKCHPGAWSPGTTLSYQWSRNGAYIAHSKHGYYRVRSADEHSSVRCHVIARNAVGTTKAKSAPVKIATLCPFGTSSTVTCTPRAGAGLRFAGTVADEVMVGTDASDLMHGGSGRDVLNGGDGDDIMFGQRGNDSMYGNGGADSLFGGAGDDFLFGGSSLERVLRGGSGTDIVWWEPQA